MKTEIHPEYKETQVTCSCGNTFVTRSTKGELHVELCNQCHPFYTGKQKLVDTGGRVERLNRKYAKRHQATTAPEAEPAPAETPEPADTPEASASSDAS